MKFNKMRDFMKYLTKYITKDILIVISILLFVSIVFLVLTNKVIENVDNNMSNSKTKTPRDNKLSEAAKKHIKNGNKQMGDIAKDMINHVSNKSSKENTK